MFGVMIACACLLADAPKPTPDELVAYREARAKAGRDADAHVRLALWCEARGMVAERAEHLAMAVAADPANATARGLKGQIDDEGRWRRTADVAERVKQDATLSASLVEYAEKRAKAPQTAEGQWKLALWCAANGLGAEARAHLTTTVRLDPSREAAWKKLGCKKVNGRWLSDEQIASNRAEAEAQKQADRHWKARFEKIRDDLKVPARKAEADQALAQISDPRAVPMALRVLGTGDLTRLIQVLGQIDGAAASHALARVAVAAADAGARRAATETLRLRDAREFAPALIAAIQTVVKYKVDPVGGPGSTGVLLVEGKQFDRRRFYSPPPPVSVVPQAGDFYDVDADGLPVLVRPMGRMLLGRQSLQDRANQLNNFAQAPLPPALGETPEVRKMLGKIVDAERVAARKEANYLNRVGETPGIGNLGPEVVTSAVGYERIPVGRMQLEAQRTAASAQAQMEADIASIEDYNRPIKEQNGRLVEVLRAISGKDFGDDRDSWSHWSADLRGYAIVMPPSLGSRPTFDEAVPLAVETVPITLERGPASQTIINRHSCFTAGTPVRTRSGDRPIETIAAGDVLLVQDPATGALSFQPVVAVYHNPPNETLRIDLEGDHIVATPIHRFWKAGHGWVMARELKVGDPIRTSEGIAKVTAVRRDRVQPVFNLEVAHGRSFLVGKLGALVHDNSLVETITKPFDFVANLAKVPVAGATAR